MTMTFDDARDQLYQAPLGEFVAERKRLAAALKAGGDKDGAAQLAKLGRPVASAWVVNQLWWHARDAFAAMLAASARLREGARDDREYRDALAGLRGRAAAMLIDAGHGATEAVLRRVTATLSALAVAGGFAPDAAGALAEDREAPGFAALSAMTFAPPAPPRLSSVPPPSEPKPAPPVEAKPARADREPTAAERARIAAEHARAAEEAARARAAEQARIAAARGKLDAELADARRASTFAERDVLRLDAELADAKKRAADARAEVTRLEAELARSS